MIERRLVETLIPKLIISPQEAMNFIVKIQERTFLVDNENK